MSEVATMQLVAFGSTKILAGHSASAETVYVLRKDGDEYHLHAIPVEERDQCLRSFIAASDSELMELSKAIAATMPTKRRGQR